MTLSDRTKARFWAKVSKTDGCWLWTGAKLKGYGLFRVPESEGGMPFMMRAHRISYSLHGGVPLAYGLVVCHSCDNPSCVNPSHLFVGTMADNMKDAANKNRMCKNSGEKSHYHKLNLDQVSEIKSLKGVVSGTKVADKFGIGSTQVYRIWRGECWV